MDILKRNMAPLTQLAWDEIDSRAEEVWVGILLLYPKADLI